MFSQTHHSYLKDLNTLQHNFISSIRKRMRQQSLEAKRNIFLEEVGNHQLHKNQQQLDCFCHDLEEEIINQVQNTLIQNGPAVDRSLFRRLFSLVLKNSYQKNIRILKKTIQNYHQVKTFIQTEDIYSLVDLAKVLCDKNEQNHPCSENSTIDDLFYIVASLSDSISAKQMLSFINCLNKKINYIQLQNGVISFLYKIRHNFKSLIKWQNLEHNLIQKKLDVSQSAETHLRVLQILLVAIERKQLNQMVIYNLLDKFKQIVQNNHGQVKFSVAAQYYVFRCCQNLVEKGNENNLFMILNHPIFFTILKMCSFGPNKHKSFKTLSYIVQKSMQSQTLFKFIVSTEVFNILNDNLRAQDNWLVFQTLMTINNLIQNNKIQEMMNFGIARSIERLMLNRVYKKGNSIQLLLDKCFQSFKI